MSVSKTKKQTELILNNEYRKNITWKKLTTTKQAGERSLMMNKTKKKKSEMRRETLCSDHV